MPARKTNKKILALVSQNMREHLTASGMKKSEFAEFMGTDVHNIDRLLRADCGMTLRTLTRVCYALGVTPNDILDYHTPIPRNENRRSATGSI